MKKLALKKPSLKLKLPIKNKKLLLIPLGILLLSLIPSYYFWNKYQETQLLLKDPQGALAAENRTLVDTVSKLMDVPSDETPTVATVADKDKLKEQPLFARAQNGDKILVYTSLKKAILYRPGLGKIIDVIPVNVGPQEASPSPTMKVGEQVQSASPPRFILRNGTTIAGFTRRYEAELLSKVANAEIIARENASSQVYEQTTLYDLLGSRGEQAKSLSTTLGVRLGGSIPTEEATTGADFLIILGEDRE